jgi:hypothetical protein
MYKESPNFSVRIPVKLVDAKLVRTDGSQLPEIADGAEFDVVFSLSALKNQKDAQAFLAMKAHTIAEKGTDVFLGLVPGSIPVGRCGELISPSDLKLISRYLLIQVQLREDLNLCTQPGKQAWLESCKCFLPLLNTEAQSLNHAYTIASEEFETNRISHTANVFSRAYLRESAHWTILQEIRTRLESTT